MVEDVIFNELTSAIEYDIQSIQLIVPGSVNQATGIDKYIAVFKCKDLVNYFKDLPKEEIAWYNPNNNIVHITWLDAFPKRMFSSRIFKLEHPDGATIDELYDKTPGDRNGLYVAQKLEEELIEQECFFSEY